MIARARKERGVRAATLTPHRHRTPVRCNRQRRRIRSARAVVETVNIDVIRGAAGN
jgi:hypothetical protein